jgi:Tfp pilus assembly protein PilF
MRHLSTPTFPAFLRLVFLGVCVSFSLAGAGCSREAKIERYTKKADEYYKAAQYQKAEIEFLNILRLDSANLNAGKHLGLMAFDQGRIGPSFALLTQVKKRVPTDLEVRLKLARCLLAGGSPQQAREEAAFVLSKDPRHEDALRVLVESSTAADQLLDAVQRLERLKAAIGGKSGYHIAWGMVQARARDFNAAEASFRKAVELDPKSSSAHATLGAYLLSRGERSAAEPELKLAAELASPRSRDRLPYLDFKLSAGEFKIARELLDEAAKSTPDYLPVQTRLSQLDIVEEKYEDAERRLNGILTRDPTHLEGLLLMGRLYHVQDAPRKSLAVLQRASQQYPRVPQVHYQLALSTLQNGEQVSVPVSHLNEALRLRPDFPDAIMLLAELNLRRGDSAAAIASLTQLIAQHPALPGAHVLLAAAYRGRGNDTEATKVFQNLARLYPSNPQVPVRIGMALRQQGKVEDARRGFDAALTLAPRYIPALEQLVLLDIEEKRLEAAKERVQREIELDPKSAPLHVILAKVHVAESNYTAAETELLKATKLSPGMPEAESLLDRVYVISLRL